MIATIGYEKCSLGNVIQTLKAGSIDLLVDIRDRAQSRRPGFSKSALSSALNAAGIEYMHMRALGDPKAGRDAARSGRLQEFRSIFLAVLEQNAAQDALRTIEELARSRRVCLMCYERDPTLCHRKLVSDRLEIATGCRIIHLGVNLGCSASRNLGRMLYPCESSTA